MGIYKVVIKNAECISKYENDHTAINLGALIKDLLLKAVEDNRFKKIFNDPANSMILVPYLIIIEQDINDSSTLEIEFDRSDFEIICFGNKISVRQTDVLFWKRKGKSDKETADRLNISPHTVNSHLKAVYALLKVGSIGQVFVKLGYL